MAIALVFSPSMVEGIPDPIRDGPQKQVRFLILPSGDSPAFSFLEKLQKDPKTSAKAMAVLRTAERLADSTPLPRKIYRTFDDTFSEIVCTGCRMLTYVHKGDLYLVHGFLKKEDKAPRKEVRTAKRILREFLGDPP